MKLIAINRLKVLVVAAVVAVAGALATPALAAPTLELTGACRTQDGYDWFELAGTGADFGPGAVLAVAVEMSYGPTGTMRWVVPATGTLSGALYSVAFPSATRTIESITYVVRVFTNDDGNLQLDPGETILAEASLTLVCPLSLTEILAQLETSGVLDEGEAKSLLVKIESAGSAAAKGNTTAASNQLEAFINEVEAMVRSGRLTEEAGARLIALAEARIAALPGR